MGSTSIPLSLIKKVAHPVQEIRERALHQIISKQQLGWEWEEELACTRELLLCLLAWFHSQIPTLKREALQLLLKVLRSKAGSYNVRELGASELLHKLEAIKPKIDDSNIDIFEDIVDAIKFLCTVESEENIPVPHLDIPSATSSEGEVYVQQGEHDDLALSTESSFSNLDFQQIDEINVQSRGITVFLLPWADLCSSDSKTLLLIEDALKLVKSTRRCCRFIRDVFLRDFPAEIFLNRPTIVQRLLGLVDVGSPGKVSEVLEVLLWVCKAVRVRIQELTSIEFAFTPGEDLSERNRIGEDDVEEMAAEFSGVRIRTVRNDIEMLQQMPVPFFCLDSLQTILTAMTRSAILVESDNSEQFDVFELTLCVSLVESLADLLVHSVEPVFWRGQHASKMERDIAHKSCVAMRMLGELLNRYRKPFFQCHACCRKSFSEEASRQCHRVCWLRLVQAGGVLGRWCAASVLPNPSLVNALRDALIDAPMMLLYPRLYDDLCNIVMNSSIQVDKEFKRKYEDSLMFFKSIEFAIQFLKDIDSCRKTKAVLTIINESLPALELHNSEAFVQDVTDILWKTLKDWNMEEDDWSLARHISLALMAHNLDWVQIVFYKGMLATVKKILTGNLAEEDEKCLVLLSDVGILTEICCHGLRSKVVEVQRCANESMVLVLRGRLLVSERCWWRLLASLLPMLPLLHSYAAHDTDLGRAICKSLEVEIAECMGVSRAEVLLGLTRLLFVKCPTVQMEAALQLTLLIVDDELIPPKGSLRADILVKALRAVVPSDFNVDMNSQVNKNVPTTSLNQILEMLKQDLVLVDEKVEVGSMRVPTLEPSIRRSALQQLAVLMQQPALHDAFLQHAGVDIVAALLRMSLLAEDYLAFPECSISCVSVLNSLCVTNRNSLTKIPQLIPLLLRVPIIFPSSEEATRMVAQLLCAIAWSEFLLHELDDSKRRVLSAPHAVLENIRPPFPLTSYWRTSTNRTHSVVDWLLAVEEWRSLVRVRWSASWHGVRSLLHGGEMTYNGAALRLKPTSKDLALMRCSCPLAATTQALLQLQSATTHRDVHCALHTLQSYTYLVVVSGARVAEYAALPWARTLAKFLGASPASPRDVLLLTRVLRLIIDYLDNVATRDGNEKSAAWISQSLTSEGSVILLLNKSEMYPDQSHQETVDVTQLHVCVVKLLLRCNLIASSTNYQHAEWESLFKLLLASLEQIDLRNFHKLGYLNEVMRCLRYIASNTTLSVAACVLGVRSAMGVLAGLAPGSGRKGYAARLDASLILLALLNLLEDARYPVQSWCEHVIGGGVGAVVACCAGAGALAAAAARVLASLALHVQLLPHLHQATEEGSLGDKAMRLLACAQQCNAVRAAAAAILAALATRVPSSAQHGTEADVLWEMEKNNFDDITVATLVEFCTGKKHAVVLEGNVPTSVIERREQYEVKVSKRGLWGSPRWPKPQAQLPDHNLVAAISDVIYNACSHPHCPFKEWNDKGIFRMLFRCSCVEGKARAPARNALARASQVNAKVRRTLAETRDCLHAFLTSLTTKPTVGEEVTSDETSPSLLLLGSLLYEENASIFVMKYLGENKCLYMYQTIMKCLSSEDNDLRHTGYFCLSQLMFALKRHNRSIHDTCVEGQNSFDSMEMPSQLASPEPGLCGEGLSSNEDCQPEYIAEAICKCLMRLYVSATTNRSAEEISSDESWRNLSSCLASVLCMSNRARSYAAHRAFSTVLLSTLNDLRNALTLQPQSVESIRNASAHPIIGALFCVVVLMDSSMLHCSAAKEALADSGVAQSLNKLWPWFMLTKPLREAVVHMLATFTNDCPKAWGAMCWCAGGRCLMGELSTLVCREMALQRSSCSKKTLLLALSTLTQCAGHHHCRAIILKSEVLRCINKLHPAVNKGGWGVVGTAWERLCEALARHADGAGRLLELRPALAALAQQQRAMLVPLAHAAHHHRTLLLQSPEVIQVWCELLLRGEVAAAACVARAVWALAANNHKAKQVLRTYGVTAALGSCVQRLRSSPRDAQLDRALHLLTYTHRVLTNT